jgi:hypothetical protein
MKISEIEVDQKYICDYDGKRFFTTVKRKSDTQVYVTLGDVVNEDGDPGDPTFCGRRSGHLENHAFSSPV